MGCFVSRSITSPTTTINPELPDSSPFGPAFTPNSSPLLNKPRTVSLATPLVHHPPVKKGDTHHLVALTSTTYGSLLLVETQNPKLSIHGFPKPLLSAPYIAKEMSKETKTRAIEDAKGELSPDSVINTWELMDGLDDFDFDDQISRKSASLANDRSINYSESDSCMKKSPDLVKSSEVLSEVGSIVETTLSALDEFKDNSLLSSKQSSLLDEHDRIILYFTSLRGIRKTCEDCWAVRMILRGFRVTLDERDISMDSSYRKELQSKLEGKKLSLPQVFIRGKHIGGAEEIRQLNENGELARLLEGFPTSDFAFVCETCGEARFLPCPSCSGSRKVFDKDSEHFRRCTACNENGLIHCPNCCT